jgi:hypothetical protein
MQSGSSEKAKSLEPLSGHPFHCLDYTLMLETHNLNSTALPLLDIASTAIAGLFVPKIRHTEAIEAVECSDALAWLGFDTLALAWLERALASYPSSQSQSHWGGLGLAWLWLKP